MMTAVVNGGNRTYRRSLKNSRSKVAALFSPTAE
jgi:hypothetical protein